MLLLVLTRLVFIFLWSFWIWKLHIFIANKYSNDNNKKSKIRAGKRKTKRKESLRY
jgi:hypothetical protein